MDEIIGIVKRFAGNFAPVNFMDCDGASLSIASYEVLFSVLGVTYGGDGVTTFKLPDMRDVDPNTHQKQWDPDKPRFIICVNGVYPSRN